MTATPTGVDSVLAELASADRLLVQQVFKPIANEYRISVPLPGSTEEARPLLFVKQKKMQIREDIRFRLSPDDEAHVFMIKGKTVFEFRGRHDVLDAQESNLIVALVRRFAGLLPEWLSLLSWIPFNFELRRDGKQVGSYKRVLGPLRDRYVLELSEDVREVDHRLLVAFTVALDALQDR